VHNRCQSCGDFPSYRYHNDGYLCYACYNFDKRGFARAKDGTIISSEEEMKVLNDIFDKSRGYKK
jgi:hypothetical protein